MKAGRHNVRKRLQRGQLLIRVVGWRTRNLYQSGVRWFIFHEFCLIAAVRSRLLIQTVTFKAVQTGHAMSSAMSKRYDYKVARFNLADVCTRLFNNPDRLMTNQRIGFSFGNAAVPPQIRTTDTCSNDTNDSLVFTIDFWLGSFLDLNFSLNWVSRVMLSGFGQKYFQLRLDQGD